MRPARAVLEELVRHVQPPKGCAIVFTERPLNKSDDPNWIVTVGPMGAQYIKRYTDKVAQLRKSDLRIDWSEVKSLDGHRRVAFQLSDLSDK
jgi:hypothetical protein